METLENEIIIYNSPNQLFGGIVIQHISPVSIRGERTNLSREKKRFHFPADNESEEKKRCSLISSFRKGKVEKD